MIGVVRLWETVMQTAKKGTAGYQDEDEFNRDLAAVQTELMGVLAPLYASSRAVKDLLAPFIVTFSGNTSVAGLLAKPDDYFQVANISISGHPATPVDVNEAPMLNYIPSRTPSVANNIYAYYEVNDDFTVLPQGTALPAVLTYIRHPEEASIVLTPVSDENGDYLTPTAGDDLEWPERAFNFIYYMMLQKLGLEAKEQLLIEYSNLGLRSESVKTQ